MSRSYNSMIRPPRSDSAAPIIADERAPTSRHLAHLQPLRRAGVVRHAGRCKNGDFGIAV
jgi:hypothetical protein